MIIPPGTVIGADGLRGDPDTVPTDASLYNHEIGSDEEGGGGTDLPTGVFIQTAAPVSDVDNDLWLDSDASPDIGVNGWNGEEWIAMDRPDPVGGSSESYVDEVLADAPLAYWTLGETTGTDIIDSSGNGYDGTIAGTYTLGAAGPGSSVAIAFTGVADSLVTVPVETEAGGFNTGANDWSAEIWFLCAGSLDHAKMLMGRENLQGSQLWQSFLDVDNGAGGYHKGTGGYPIVNSPDDVWTNDQWTHYVFVRDATSISVWLDGVQVVTLSTSVALATGACPFTIAGPFDTVGNAANSFPGSLAHCAFYDSALSEARIIAHRDAMV